MATSYNGWPASTNPADFGGLDNRVVPGTAGVRLAPGVRAGDVATVLFYVAAQLHIRVECGELYAPGDEWGYSYRQNRNAANLSCHSSGTAFDWNATRHPNGKRGTFTAAQVAEIRRILGEVDDVVGWGGAWGATSVPDEMHFEIQADAAAVKVVADRLRCTPAQPAPPRIDQEDEMFIRCKFDPAKPASIALLSGPMFVNLVGDAVTSAQAAIAKGATVLDVGPATWGDLDRRSHNLTDSPRVVTVAPGAA